VRQRRHFRWPTEARDVVRDYKDRLSKGDGCQENERCMLVAKLAELSGNPRDACSRFLRQSGVIEKRSYREWTKPEQQRLLDLITTMPVVDAARILRRPVGSVRSSVAPSRNRRTKRPRLVYEVLLISSPAHSPGRNTEVDRSGLAQIPCVQYRGRAGANHRRGRLLRVRETAWAQSGGAAAHL